MYRLRNKSSYSRVIEWGKLIAITGSAQITIQLLGVLGGIFIIRLLPSHEYGLYTLANTMLGTITVLSDAGVSNGVMAQGGMVWQDRQKLGAVLVTGFDLRKKLSIVSLSIALPVLAYLLYRHNAGFVTTLLIILALIPSFFSALSGSLLQVGLTLNQDIKTLQKTQLFINLYRFLLSVGMLFFLPFASLAVLINGIPQLWGNIRLRRLVGKYADWNVKPDKVIRQRIITVIKRIFPGALYYCFSGQLTIWLISAFGTTTSVAKAGALGRLSVMLTVFTAIFNTLVVPRFARLPKRKDLLLKKFLLIACGLFVASIFIVVMVWLFSSQILWVLGKDYQNLETELLLVFVGACLSAMAGIFFGLSSSRSWILNPAFSISISVCAILFGIFFMNLSSLKGVLEFNIVVSLVEATMCVSYLVLKIFQIKNKVHSLTD